MVVEWQGGWGTSWGARGGPHPDPQPDAAAAAEQHSSRGPGVSRGDGGGFFQLHHPQSDRRQLGPVQTGPHLHNLHGHQVPGVDTLQVAQFPGAITDINYVLMCCSFP